MSLRYTFRSLARSPGFVVIAVLALGIGLGLSTTMFAVMDAVLHPYVGYQHPETLFNVVWWFGKRHNPMSPPELYRYIRDHTHSFSAIIPRQRYQQMTLHGQSGDVEISASRVPGRFWPVTGIEVDRGRTFREGDGQGVAVVGTDVWKNLYGRRRLFTGATVALDSSTYRIIGIMPAGACALCVWLPIDPAVERNAATADFLQPLVRLKPGVKRETAQAELTALAHLLSDRFEAHAAPFAFDLTPVVEQREEMRDIQKAMIGSALLVLLIACVNLAHLMLARGLAKQRELALRLAIGASRATIVRQMLLECLVITAAGALLGAAFTIWGAGVLWRSMPQEVWWVGLVRPQLSWRVFALSAVAAVASIVLFGLLPAVRVALAVDVNEPLKDDAGTTTGKVRQRYSALVISEVAVALVLLMGGGLLLRTLQKLQADQPNFETNTLYQGFTWWRRNPADTLPRPNRRTDLLTTARGVPGVKEVAFVTYHSLKGGGISAELTDTSRIISERGYLSVTANYARVYGLPIIKGRDFEPGDEAGSGVAIVDPVAAFQLYRNENPVGHMLKLGGPAADGRWVPIVGVIRSPSALETRDATHPRDPLVVVCERDTSDEGRFLVRLKRDDAAIPAVLQGTLKSSVGVNAYIYPYDYNRRLELISRGFLAKVFTAMGAVALGLAALGLFGVLSYAVSRRRREFAVRMALGAEPRQLLNMVLHDGAVMLLAGTGLGAFAALAAARYLDSVLVSVLPSDVIALVLSEAVLLSVGFLAATAPARRAAKANPLDIIRAV